MQLKLWSDFYRASRRRSFNYSHSDFMMTVVTYYNVIVVK
jgi:hypothetical protein